MAVTLDGNSLTHIVDTDFVETINVHIPDFVGRDPEIDSTHWNRQAFRVTYILRTTNALKWILDQILIGHTQKALVDTDYGINTNVFMVKLEAVWEGNTNHTKPWLVTIELIPC